MGIGRLYFYEINLFVIEDFCEVACDSVKMDCFSIINEQPIINKGGGE